MNNVMSLTVAEALELARAISEAAVRVHEHQERLPMAYDYVRIVDQTDSMWAGRPLQLKLRIGERGT